MLCAQNMGAKSSTSSQPVLFPFCKLFLLLLLLFYNWVHNWLEKTLFNCKISVSSIVLKLKGIVSEEANQILCEELLSRVNVSHFQSLTTQPSLSKFPNTFIYNLNDASHSLLWPVTHSCLYIQGITDASMVRKELSLNLDISFNVVS